MPKVTIVRNPPLEKNPKRVALLSRRVVSITLARTGWIFDEAEGEGKGRPPFVSLALLKDGTLRLKWPTRGYAGDVGSTLRRLHYQSLTKGGTSVQQISYIHMADGNPYRHVFAPGVWAVLPSDDDYELRIFRNDGQPLFRFFRE